MVLNAISIQQKNESKHEHMTIHQLINNSGENMANKDSVNKSQNTRKSSTAELNENIYKPPLQPLPNSGDDDNKASKSKNERTK